MSQSTGHVMVQYKILQHNMIATALFDNENRHDLEKKLSYTETIMMYTGHNNHYEELLFSVSKLVTFNFI